jgi:Domain of unknown function (DUF222)
VLAPWSRRPMTAAARTGGHTALPMCDAIRLGAGGIHYLAVFDDHTERPLYLGRQTRIATADQRIICYARDGGRSCVPKPEKRGWPPLTDRS